VLKCEQFQRRNLKILRLSKALRIKTAGGMNTRANDRSELAAALRAVAARDLDLSIGLALVVMTLTSVMGSI
jgi:hypothetical protein